MNRAAPHIRKLLAAEYVVGTLHGRARQRFERLMAKDAGLRSLVVQWQGRLQPLDMQAMAIEPHPRVKQRIDARIAEIAQRSAQSVPAVSEVKRASGRAQRPSWWSAWWSNVNLWRFAAVAASALTVVFALRMAVPPEPAAPEYIAVLVDDQKEPAIVLRGQGKDMRLALAFIKPSLVPSDRDLELWALPDGGAPRSLGVLPRGRAVAVAMKQSVQTTLHAIPALAISVEPRGGSATGAPTGPVVLHGKLSRSGAI